MKLFRVILYQFPGLDNRYNTFDIIAYTEEEAIEKAKEIFSYSVWESYAYEL